MINNSQLDKVIEGLEHILENDPRTMSCPDSEDGWYYDDIYKAYKILKNTWLKQDIHEKGGPIIHEQSV